MTRTKIGPLVAFALILMSTTQGANAAPSNSVIASIRHSTDEAGLLQKIHVYDGKTYHPACAGGHNWRYRRGADGVLRPVYYSPCVFIWRPWRRPRID